MAGFKLYDSIIKFKFFPSIIKSSNSSIFLKNKSLIFSFPINFLGFSFLYLIDLKISLYKSLFSS